MMTHAFTLLHPGDLTTFQLVAGILMMWLTGLVVIVLPIIAITKLFSTRKQ